MSDEKLENSGAEEKCCCGGHEHSQNEDSCCHDHEEDCCCDHEEGECGCGCGCEEEVMIVELENENGEIVPCEVVDEFLFNEQLFVLVQNPEDGSVYMFKVIGEGEEGELIVPEEDEFKEASAYYEKLMEQQ